MIAIKEECDTDLTVALLAYFNGHFMMIHRRLQDDVPMSCYVPRETWPDEFVFGVAQRLPFRLGVCHPALLGRAVEARVLGVVLEVRQVVGQLEVHSLDEFFAFNYYFGHVIPLWTISET